MSIQYCVHCVIGIFEDHTVVEDLDTTLND